MIFEIKYKFVTLELIGQPSMIESEITVKMYEINAQ